MKQLIRGITHFLYFFSILFTGFALIFAVAREGNTVLLIASVIGLFLAAIGAVLNFTSPSYRSEEDMTETMRQHCRKIVEVDRLRMKYVRKIEELEEKGDS
jgi:uncharacterized membrane protein YeiB